MENSTMLKKMSEKEKSYSLFGLALGDGHYRQSSIYIQHTDKQKEYVEMLEKIFKDAGLSYFAKYNSSAETSYGTYIYHRIRVSVPQRRHYDKYNRLINQDGVKHLSDYVLNRITALGLLFWWLDDGTLHVSHKDGRTKRFGYLSTESFSEFDNEKLVKMLQKRFNIETRIHHYREYCRLYINATNFKKLLDLWRKYLPDICETMRYKLNPRYGEWKERGVEDDTISQYSYQCLFKSV